MEPDVHVLPGAPPRVQREDAGADRVGPGQSQRGGEPVPGRSEDSKRSNAKAVCGRRF